MKDRPEVRYRRQKESAEVLHERKDGRIPVKPKCPAKIPTNKTNVTPSDMPKNLIFPNSTPAAITKAYNATICAIELGFVNKSCSQFIDIKLVYSGGKCNQLKIIGQTFLLFSFPTFLSDVSYTLSCPKTLSPLAHVLMF